MWNFNFPHLLHTHDHSEQKTTTTATSKPYWKCLVFMWISHRKCSRIYSKTTRAERRCKNRRIRNSKKKHCNRQRKKIEPWQMWFKAQAGLNINLNHRLWGSFSDHFVVIRLCVWLCMCIVCSRFVYAIVAYFIHKMPNSHFEPLGLMEPFRYGILYNIREILSRSIAHTRRGLSFSPKCLCSPSFQIFDCISLNAECMWTGGYSICGVPITCTPFESITVLASMSITELHSHWIANTHDEYS